METNKTGMVFQIQDGDLISYGVIGIRFLALLSILLNMFVLICLLYLKQTFRSYGLWFQLFSLANVDTFNGIVSFSFSFIRNEVFCTNYYACSILIWAFIFGQINTMATALCICIHRLCAICTIDNPHNTRSVIRHTIPIVLTSFISCIYCVCPFLVWDTQQHDINQCSGAFLFGLNEKYFKLYIFIGIFLPWISTNVLYGICVFKLKRSVERITPGRQTSTTIAKESASLRNKESRSPDFLNKDSVTAAHVSENRTTTCVMSDTDLKSVKTCTSAASARRYIKAFKSGRAAQLKAVKLLGIIIVLNTISVMIPVSVLLRDVLVAETGVASMRGATILSFVFLCLNSLVDAFVYGLYTEEIRTFLLTKFQTLRFVIVSRFT